MTALAVLTALLALGIIISLPPQPSHEDVLQAQQDLALAFRYIDKAGLITGQDDIDIVVAVFCVATIVVNTLGRVLFQTELR